MGTRTEETLNGHLTVYSNEFNLPSVMFACSGSSRQYGFMTGRFSDYKQNMSNPD